MDTETLTEHGSACIALALTLVAPAFAQPLLFTDAPPSEAEKLTCVQDA